MSLEAEQSAKEAMQLMHKDSVAALLLPGWNCTLINVPSDCFLTLSSNNAEKTAFVPEEDPHLLAEARMKYSLAYKGV